ncbi:unnamed protein product, partial [Ectocarpus sp. 8 AP-2014]
AIPRRACAAASPPSKDPATPPRPPPSLEGARLRSSSSPHSDGSNNCWRGVESFVGGGFAVLAHPGAVSLATTVLPSHVNPVNRTGSNGFSSPPTGGSVVELTLLPADPPSALFCTLP